MACTTVGSTGPPEEGGLLAAITANQLGFRQAALGGPEHVNECLDSVRRIAVLRCNALGDYLMVTPALAALRRTFPDAELTLHAGRWHADFLSGRPGPVDRVRVVPRVAGLAGQPGGAPPEGALPQFLADARALLTVTRFAHEGAIRGAHERPSLIVTLAR
jgi:hypothetical protein